MLRLKRAQRALLGETFRDAGNLAAGAMIFGQFLADSTFSAAVAFGGLVVWVVFVVAAVRLAGEELQ